ncbi:MULTISPECIES: hypothetical protein [Streptomyces]|uniref:hypothetical protein n=1 Tax=Streptomyces TaxID=1883 RepID=UPI0021B2841B|nr:hypothetical protein [Streptomyces sp. CS-7]MCT6781921.1 hypothetical protein [Streptomyces sp. CS-7]
MQLWEQPERAAIDYAFFYTDLVPVTDTPNTWEAVVADCPDCKQHALVPDARTALPVPGPTALCFACSKVFHHLTDCGGCGRTMDSGMPDKFPMCSRCLYLRRPEEAMR